ncbi:MAG: hypothetical protein ACYTG2_01505 [Planctomycetota bacterium]|jgi:hypothetical protein
MPPRLARILVVTGTCLSLALFALAFFVHIRLYENDLARADALETSLRAQLRAPPVTGPESEGGRGVDPLDLALAAQALAMPADPAAIYHGTERQAFAAARVRGALDQTQESRTLMPPARVEAVYAGGTVVITWDPGPVNAVLAGALAGQESDLSLAFRIYRSRDLGGTELLQTVPFGTSSWKDRDLPLPRARLDYEVWTVLLRAGPTGEVLVGAERSEKVTVRSPEHFKLDLVGGSEEQAAFDVEVGLPSDGEPVVVNARPGEPLLVGGQPLGLTLQSLTQTVEDRLTTHRRMVLTADGSLVLDPITREPRTTQTQILLPVKHLTATLVSHDGEVRTLEADLP